VDLALSHFPRVLFMPELSASTGARAALPAKHGALLGIFGTLLGLLRCYDTYLA